MYLALILFSFMFVLIDSGMEYLNQYITRWHSAQKEQALKEKEKRSMQSKTVIKRKITQYNSKLPPHAFIANRLVLPF